jgi:hypothetical protein
MKKIIRNNRIIAIALMTIFSVGMTQAAMAHENPNFPVTLTYAGKVQNQPAFLLKVNGDADNNDFKIIIYDEAGNVLYAENIKSENFTKKFILNTDEIGNDPLRFEITSRKTNQKVTYKINQTSRFVDELAINLIK